MTGHPLKETPQLDRMAQEGIFFTDFYTRSFVTKFLFDDFNIRSLSSSLMLLSIKPIGDSAMILQLEKHAKRLCYFFILLIFVLLKLILLKLCKRHHKKALRTYIQNYRKMKGRKDYNKLNSTLDIP